MFYTFYLVVSPFIVGGPAAKGMEPKDEKLCRDNVAEVKMSRSFSDENACKALKTP